MRCDRTRSVDLAAFAAEPSAAEFASFREHYPACPECAREVERWTRLESGLRAGSDAEAHPATDALWTLARRPERLGAREREDLAAHLARCARCRSELAALRGFDFARLREPLAVAPRLPSRRLPARRRRWVQTSAAAAAAVVTLALGIQWLRGRTPGAEAPREAPLAATGRQPVAPAPPPEPPRARAPEPTQVAEASEGRKPAPEEVARAEPPPAPPLPARTEPAPTRAAPAAPREPAPAAREPARPTPTEVAAVFPAEPLVYVAPGPRDPALARLRAPSVLRGASGTALRIQALAPDHVGLTVEASPTLYWAVSTATEERVELVVTDERAERPLVDHALDGAREGIHALPLSQLGVTLEPGVTYRWYATIVPDPEDRTRELVSGGAIRRVALDPALAARLAQSGPGQRAHRLAEAGLFYDALDAASVWVRRHPDAAEPRRHRQELLAAVGLDSVLGGEPSGPP